MNINKKFNTHTHKVTKLFYYWLVILIIKYWGKKPLFKIKVLNIVKHTYIFTQPFLRPLF